MINMSKIIKKNKIRAIFKKRGFRIGSKALKKLASKIEENLAIHIERAKRSALISGRKTIKIEDFES